MVGKVGEGKGKEGEVEGGKEGDDWEGGGIGVWDGSVG